MKTPDPRARHTRAALLQAFRELLLQGRPIGDIRSQEVAARAGVGRSTLYEHFAGVNGLLAASIAGPFSILTQAVDPGAPAPEIERLLEHFWEQRALARNLFSGPLRGRSVAVLVQLIEQKFKAAGLARRGRLILPARLAAVQMAELLLAPISAWLAGESRCSARELAVAVAAVARAAMAALQSAA